MQPVISRLVDVIQRSKPSRSRDTARNEAREDVDMIAASSGARMTMTRKRDNRVLLAVGLVLVAVVTAPPLRAQAPTPTPTPTPMPDSVPPPSVTVIGPSEARGVLGRHVRSPADEDMGHIVDVIVDRTGTVRAAVIDFGGFLGVGSRKIVVDWNALHFGRVANKADSITLDLTKDQVRAAPEYKEDKPLVVLGAAGNLQPFQFDR